MSITFNTSAAASAMLGVSGVGPEHKLLCCYAEQQMMVVFNACAPNVPSSLPAFLYSHSKPLERRGQFTYWSRKSLIHFFSAEWAQRSCEAGECCPEQTKWCFVLLGSGLARRIPVWLYNSLSCSSSRQGHVGCLVQVSAPGWLTEPLHLQSNITSTCIRRHCDGWQAHTDSW